jgi:hypothetical protein
MGGQHGGNVGLNATHLVAALIHQVAGGIRRGEDSGDERLAPADSAALAAARGLSAIIERLGRWLSGRPSCSATCDDFTRFRGMCF